MNKLSTQKFMNLFNEILTDNKGIGATRPVLKEQELKGDEIDVLNVQKEEQLESRLSQRNILFLKKVEAAKEKIENGTYGVCEDCGCDISQKRLLARPTANFCISCQEAKETLEKHNINHRRDLKISAKKKDQGDGYIMENKKYTSVKDIEFESVVDL
jgi:DnaK suppressor protein